MQIHSLVLLEFLSHEYHFKTIRHSTQIRTVGDAELMRAHRYYELLYSTKPEEILDIIEEHGPEYTEQDYVHLLQLQHRSFPASERGNFDLNKYEQLIKNVFHSESKNSK